MRDWRNVIRASMNNIGIDPAREAEIIEELNQHLNDRYEELLAQGVSQDQAEKTMLDEFSGGKLAAELQSSLKPERRRAPETEERQTRTLAELWQNVRYGARLLRFNPGFASIMILSLALGIGANTAIFQLINAVRLRTLPVDKPEELANIKVVTAPDGRTGRAVGPTSQLTTRLWEQIQQQQQGFSKVAAFFSQSANLNQGGEVRYAQVLYVSGGFFDLIGVQGVTGRLISHADDRPGCSSPAAVISQSFWHREYGGTNAVIGRKVMLDGHPFEIVGVTPASFFGIEVGRNFDVALPLCAESIIHADDPYAKDPQTWWLAGLGRLKPGWDVERASAQLAAISPGMLRETTPEMYDATDRKGYHKMIIGAVAASNGISRIRKSYENPLWLLLAISAFVLLIACANLANLMVARASARAKEMAVRLAIGATRSQLIRQLLSESLLIALCGAILGALLAQILSRALITFLSTERSVVFLSMQPDWRVIGFTTALAIFTCLIFGLWPAIQASRIAPGEAMKANSRGTTSGRSRFESRRLLVVSQVALSLMLLIGALLFVRTFHNLTSLDAGFTHDRLLVTTVEYTPLKIPKEQRFAYKEQLLEKIRSLRTVQSAATVAVVPLSGSLWNSHISIPELKVERQLADFNQISDKYFETVGTRIIAGRDFSQTDTVNSPLVAIVTQMFVKKYLNNQNPIGQHFRVIQQAGEADRVYEIVGLVNDVKYTDLREEFTPIVFLPESQEKEQENYSLVVVRSNEDLSVLTASIRNLVRQTHPSLVIEFNPFRTLVRQGLLRERLMATLSGFFGLLAAILAMIGLYGVISYMVASRRNEIGIRMALGADRKSILTMILREATILLIAGLLLGTFFTLITGSALRALLFGLQPNDPITISLAVLALAATATLASLFPAQRAATLNPTQALHEE